jgi:hypothetical protein
METRTGNAKIFLRDANTGNELPFVTLNKTGLILAEMNGAAPLTLDVRTSALTRVTVELDGKQVLHTAEMLKPGQHNLRAADLSFAPAEAAASIVEDTPDPSPDSDEAYLASLGVAVGKPAKIDPPYIGEPKGVLKVRIGYFVMDNGVEHQSGGDELTFKLGSKSAFCRAVAENYHRVEWSEGDPDPDHAPGPLCGLHALFERDHHH